MRNLIGTEERAVHKRNKASFKTTVGKGEQPQMCVPAVEFTTELCETALVTGTDANMCKIKVSKKGRISATVLAPSIGDTIAVIAPHDLEINVQVRCTGKPPTVIKLSKPSLVELPTSCTMEGEGWRLRAMEVRHMALNIIQRQPMLGLPALNLTRPALLHDAWVQQLKMSPELQVPVLDFKRLVDMPKYRVEGNHFRMAGYAIVIIMCIIIGIACYLVWHCRLYRKLVGRYRSPKKDTENCLSSIEEVLDRESVPKGDDRPSQEQCVSAAREWLKTTSEEG